MSAVAFDTLKLARKLRDTAHMSAEQAEGIADALAEAMSGAELATKADVAASAAELKAEIGASERRLEIKLGDVRADLLKTILAAVAVNSAVVVGALFGLAKLLGH
jgi:hypothetical protein